MEIPFVKMQGAGNDFIIIEHSNYPYGNDYSNLAKSCCHRNFGIGADGFMVVKASDVADIKMLYYNRDGTAADMCGNGIRCFVKYVYDNGLVRKDVIMVETKAGVLTAEVIPKANKAHTVKINMGKIITSPKLIPVDFDGDDFINKKMIVDGKEFDVSTVLMGVPHTIIFVDELQEEMVKYYGPLIEKHPIFLQKTNVNFAKIVNNGLIRVKTWERGAGYTLACGTGVTSVCGVAYLLGRAKDEIWVDIDGGRLFIQIDDDGLMSMEGPAMEICKGHYFYNNENRNL